MHASWLIAVFAACVCCPAAMDLCWESSVCSDLRSKERLLDCISLCGSRTQVSTHRSTAPDDEDDPWLDLLLSSLGGPPPEKPLRPSARGRNEDQRRYVMEHFRWEKPYGRKLRPDKVATSSTEGAVTSQWTGVSPPPTGGVVVGEEEQGTKDGKKVVLDVRDLEVQPLQGVTFGPQVSLLSTQDTKDAGTYRMNHFRWGSPPKRHGRFLNLWAKKPLPKRANNQSLLLSGCIAEWGKRIGNVNGLVVSRGLQWVAATLPPDSHPLSAASRLLGVYRGTAN
ncbi:Pro-opiomelanocortin B [Merluccius polli]|uniref:Pro-opiomelanocortin B n=1 Tax=Merluccius polli TaxID=89951 RepID=A0AA47NP04_MERPO|nr:Pro-opiomelanocortin B [Merluccius polli]